MNKGLARWRNTPVPNQNTTVEIFATLSNLTLSGHIGVNLESIILGAMPPVYPRSNGEPPLPVKKWKFTSTAALSVCMFHMLCILLTLSHRSEPSPIISVASNAGAVAGPSTIAGHVLSASHVASPSLPLAQTNMYVH